MDLLTQLKCHRLLAILRGVPPQHVPRLIESLRGAGIQLFEVALSDDVGLAGLKVARQAFPELTLGAGTIIAPELAQQAQDAGATFLVTPHVVPEVAKYARQHDLSLLCGALTPTEISAAYALGSAAVKVFPSSVLGPDYFKQLRGPYPNLPLLAVGGVNAANLPAYLKAGALGAGVGGSLTNADWNAPDWAKLERAAREMVEKTLMVDG